MFRIVFGKTSVQAEIGDAVCIYINVSAIFDCGVVEHTEGGCVAWYGMLHGRSNSTYSVFRMNQNKSLLQGTIRYVSIQEIAV